VSKAPDNRKWLGAVVRLGGSAVLLTLVVRLALRENFAAVTSRINGREIAVLLAGFACVHLGGLCKWRLLVRSADAGLPFVYAAQCYAAGLFGNIFLPSVIGGDMISTGMAMRRSSNKMGVVMGTIANRVLDFSALILITTGGMLHPGTWGLVTHSHLFRSSVAGAACVFAGAVGSPRRRLPRFITFRWRRLLVSVRRVCRSMAAKPGVFALGFAASLVLQTSFLLMNYWVGTLCGLHVGLAAWLFAWPLAKFIAFLPISQGGFGTREFALAGLLVPFSAKPELVVAVGLVWDVILVITGLLGGVIALVLSRFSRVRFTPAVVSK